MIAVDYFGSAVRVYYAVKVKAKSWFWVYGAGVPIDGEKRAAFTSMIARNHAG